MRCDVLRRLGAAVLVATAAALLAGAALGQEMRRNAPAVGGMGVMTLNLLEIGRQTAFFLVVSERIKMTDEQRAQIVEIVFQFQKLAGEKGGDLGVAQAELQRMLTRDQINLAQVKAKLREIQALQADVEYAGIESLLKVIRLLTHEQHVLAMASAATSESAKPRAIPMTTAMPVARRARCGAAQRPRRCDAVDLSQSGNLNRRQNIFHEREC